ncbi:MULTISPECIES: DUF4142 domain-containing protein [Novilysobacter]|uniref:DUF4142 domain-containing protein n=1 Tax=Novilysobacter TaxID=3382699 RepID=UPI002FC9F967
MKKLSTCLAVSGVLAASVVGALMLASPGPTTRARRQSPRPGLAFHAKALRAGVAAVAAGRLAQERSNDEELRRLAERIEQDHIASNAALAEASGLPSSEPGLAHQIRLDRLERLSSDAFDPAWLEHMHRGHAQSIALYQRAERTATEPQTLALVEDALGMLRGHTEQIDALLATVRPGMHGGAPDHELGQTNPEDADDAGPQPGALAH